MHVRMADGMPTARYAPTSLRTTLSNRKTLTGIVLLFYVRNETRASPQIIVNV